MTTAVRGKKPEAIQPVSPIDKAISATDKKTEAEVSIDNMPLKSLGDYMRYNKKATELNHILKLKENRYPIKPCPTELHPKDWVVVSHTNKSLNEIPIMLSDAMIDFKMKITPGKKVHLPRCVIEHIANKGKPIFQWFDNPDGSKETRVAYNEPRFAVRTIYEGN